MNHFRQTTHLSEILEESEKQAVIIFMFSNACRSSAVLREEFERKLAEKNCKTPIFLVTVQTQPVLSEKIEKWFQIKHESPQIIILNKSIVTYSAHHANIKIEDFVYN